MSVVSFSPRDADQLNKVLARADPSTRFELASGHYRISSMVTQSDVTLIGQDPANTVLELQGGNITVESGVLRLEGLTVRGGRGSMGAGIAVLNGSHLALSRCIIAGNLANHCGGGIYLCPGSALISRCLFEQNTAFWGGALFADGGSEVILERSLFLDDTAVVGGALMVASSAHLLIKSCTFLRNQATFTSAEERGGSTLALQAAGPLTPQVLLVNCLLGDEAPLDNPPDKPGLLRLASCLLPPGSLEQLKYSNGHDNREAAARFTTLSGLPLLAADSPGRGMADITEIAADALDYLGRPLVVYGDADPGALGLLTPEDPR